MMINRVSRKDPRFLPNRSGLRPCGSGKILAQCCRRFDGVVFKEPSAIRPPGLPTGYSHPRCYLGFTQNCCTKISGEKAYARGSGGSTCCGECGPALLSGLADQHLVGNRGDAGADAEESIESCVPCAAPIEAEHELIEVVLQVCPSQAVVNAQAPALEV